MKLYTGTKNTPFAIDVSLDGSTLTYSIRAVVQRKWIGVPTESHPEGGKYFDSSLVAEYRGDFGVLREPIAEREIDLDSLRSHPEFGDHASFMLYAPVGLAADTATRESLYAQTPNLYAMTIASKMDAQAYHATVLQTHPLGHILVPFKASPTSDWTIGLNVYEPSLIKATGPIQIVPSVTLALVREETLPVVRFVGGSEATVVEGGEIAISFRLETPDGFPILDREAEVYLESTSGYVVSRRVSTSGGAGSTTFRPDGLVAGDTAKIKVGFKYFSGTDDLAVTVA